MFCRFYDSDFRDIFENNQKVDFLSIRFHNPKYIDEKIIHMKVFLKNYILDTDSWEDKNVVANYTYY